MSYLPNANGTYSNSCMPSTGYGYTPYPFYQYYTHDQLLINSCLYRPRNVIYNIYAEKEKTFEAKKLRKSDGTYYMTERNGREVKIGALKLKDKFIVNQRPDGSFDALYCVVEFEGGEPSPISIPYKGFVKREILQYTKSNKSKDIILKFFLKTESSERSFILNDALYSYLKALKAKQETMMRETNDYKDFLCVNPVGALITPDSITHQFIKLLDENDLPHIRFHELRHSCISLLANNTAFSMKQIQDYAGHSDFLTTFNVYSHSDESAKKNEMDYITSCFTDLFDSSNEE